MQQLLLQSCASCRQCNRHPVEAGQPLLAWYNIAQFMSSFPGIGEVVYLLHYGTIFQTKHTEGALHSLPLSRWWQRSSQEQPDSNTSIHSVPSTASMRINLRRAHHRPLTKTHVRQRQWCPRPTKP